MLQPRPAVLLPLADSFHLNPNTLVRSGYQRQRVSLVLRRKEEPRERHEAVCRKPTHGEGLAASRV